MRAVGEPGRGLERGPHAAKKLGCVVERACPADSHEHDGECHAPIAGLEHVAVDELEVETVREPGPGVGKGRVAGDVLPA